MELPPLLELEDVLELDFWDTTLLARRSVVEVEDVLLAALASTLPYLL